MSKILIERNPTPESEFMQRYLTRKKEVVLLRGEIESLMEQATDISVHLKESPVQTSGNLDGFQGSVVEAIDKYERLAEKLIKQAEAFEQVTRAINSLEDDRQRLVLTMRYIKGWSWKKIADETHYADSEPYVIKNRAMLSIRKWMKENLPQE